MIRPTRKIEFIPEQRDATIRQALVQLLEGRQLPVSVLSQEIRKSEKELYDHLEHLQRSGILVMVPAACGACGYIFAHRSRPRKPGKCPRCKGTHIEPPLFSIALP
ncbi:transcriptional regulator [Desulfoprunum benzoelyticum]|uniref:Transcriptional regulator n=1 Tax=Desulfoprunum benzoelyticum TaxID=1506996 RepID=A0A840UYC1_9BACT|nr:transcriptional regulator [Desulfoprunum benzoelyticum]MBB5348454.1 hypothetical protein [Desulfoprunum benzoelyticum]MBM9530210.1 transcriptional regulator [Desulfoprunum benzoelyticum]